MECGSQKSGYANLIFNEADDGRMAERIFFDAQVQNQSPEKTRTTREKRSSFIPSTPASTANWVCCTSPSTTRAVRIFYTKIAVDQAPKVGWIWLNRAKYYQSAGNPQAEVRLPRQRPEVQSHSARSLPHACRPV